MTINNTYGAIALIGGTEGSIDYIPVLNTTRAGGGKIELINGDPLVATIAGFVHFYRYNESIGGDENSPYLIKPDFSDVGVEYVGDGRWELLTVISSRSVPSSYLIPTGEVVTLNNYHCLYVPEYIIEGTGELKIEDDAVLCITG